MIGKGSSIGNTGDLAKYLKEKENAVELDRHLVAGETPKQINSDFETFQNMNTRCEKNTFSFVVSPSIEDGKKLSKEEYRQIAKDFLKEMDLDKNQHIAYLHKDKEHTHVHILCNRIDSKGKAMNDSYIGKRSQRAADQVAQNHNLTRAKEVEKQKGINLEKDVTKAHQKALEQTPKNIGEYSKLMEKQGVKVHTKYSNADKLVGIRFQVGEKISKGSAIGKGLSAMNVQKAIATQLVKVKNITKDRTIERGLSL